MLLPKVAVTFTLFARKVNAPLRDVAAKVTLSMACFTPIVWRHLVLSRSASSTDQWIHGMVVRRMASGYLSIPPLANQGIA